MKMTRVNILTKKPYFFLAEFWQKSYFFMDFCGVFGETDHAVHLILTIIGRIFSDLAPKMVSNELKVGKNCLIQRTFC